MSNLIEVTDATFDELVSSASGPTVVEVGAPRCGPCRGLVALLEELGDEVGTAVRLATADADADPRLAVRLGVRGLPTLIVFEDGVEVTRRVGFGSSGPVRELVLSLVTPRSRGSS